MPLYIILPFKNFKMQQQHQQKKCILTFDKETKINWIIIGTKNKKEKQIMPLIT